MPLIFVAVIKLPTPKASIAIPKLSSFFCTSFAMASVESTKSNSLPSVTSKISKFFSTRYVLIKSFKRLPSTSDPIIINVIKH